MNLHELSPAPGSVKSAFRKGRGHGSGNGKTAGIKDIYTKCLRSNNPQNVVSAAFEGLKSLRSPEEVARIRGKSVDEILG